MNKVKYCCNAKHSYFFLAKICFAKIILNFFMLRLDLLGTAIRVTEIAPGAVKTEFSEVRWNDRKKAEKFYENFTPLLAEDIADAVFYCITRPEHVDIAEITIMPTAQAAATQIFRKDKTSS